MRIEEEIIDGVVYKKHIAEASDLSTQEQRDTWKATCTSCELYQENNTCGSCGCIVDALMALTTSKCPENKW
jgi:hypothetical protein